MIANLQHWLSFHLGFTNGSGVWYLAWSGFLSDLGEVTLVTLVIVGARHLNCGHRGCWRPYRHTTKNGHKLCKKHIQWPNDDLDLHPIHPDHL